MVLTILLMRLLMQFLNDQVNIPPRIGEARTTLASNRKLKETFGWILKSILWSGFLNNESYY